jgi:hypothetical protein
LSYLKRKKTLGLSIVELLVASTLVLLIMGEVWMMLRAGGQFYLRVKSQTETQRSALIALRWLSKDLAEGAPLSFRHYDPDNPSITTTRNGIVFGSPKDIEEAVSYDERGRLLWTTVTGYYIDPDTNVLYRTKLPLTEIDATAPRILDTVHHIDVLATLVQRRPIAHHVIDIETEQGPSNVRIRLKCRDEKLGYGLSVSTRLEMKNK